MKANVHRLVNGYKGHGASVRSSLATDNDTNEAQERIWDREMYLKK